MLTPFLYVALLIGMFCNGTFVPLQTVAFWIYIVYLLQNKWLIVINVVSIFIWLILNWQQPNTLQHTYLNPPYWFIFMTILFINRLVIPTLTEKRRVIWGWLNCAVPFGLLGLGVYIGQRPFFLESYPELIHLVFGGINVLLILVLSGLHIAYPLHTKQKHHFAARVTLLGFFGAILVGLAIGGVLDTTRSEWTCTSLMIPLTMMFRLHGQSN